MAPGTATMTAGPARAVRTSLSITDNRTGRTYEIPVEDGTIRAMDLRQIKESPDDFGLMTYDPAFMNTASCRSRITFIDGDKGILRYRGYPIEQLARHSSYLEVALLILSGQLPTRPRTCHPAASPRSRYNGTRVSTPCGRFVTSTWYS